MRLKMGLHPYLRSALCIASRLRSLQITERSVLLRVQRRNPLANIPALARIGNPRRYSPDSEDGSASTQQYESNVG
jgi:hypothetical protein